MIRPEEVFDPLIDWNSVEMDRIPKGMPVAADINFICTQALQGMLNNREDPPHRAQRLDGKITQIVRGFRRSYDEIAGKRRVDTMVYRPMSSLGDMKVRWNILGHRINLSGKLVPATSGVRRNPVETEEPFAASGDAEHSPVGQPERSHVTAAERRQVGFDFLDRPVPPGEMEQFADDFTRITHSDDRCWISPDNCVGRYIPGDDRSGSDDRTRSYVNAWHDCRVLANPDVVVHNRILDGQVFVTKGLRLEDTKRVGGEAGHRVVRRTGNEVASSRDLYELADYQSFAHTMTEIRSQDQGRVFGLSSMRIIAEITDLHSRMIYDVFQVHRVPIDSPVGQRNRMDGICVEKSHSEPFECQPAKAASCLTSRVILSLSGYFLPTEESITGCVSFQ